MSLEGKLVSFEGLDGSGKSTQIEKLRSYFQEQGRPMVVYREPGGTDISERVRSLLLHDTDEMDSTTELLLFASARSQVVAENVIPALEGGKLVVLDRFYDSTTAYQGYGHNFDIEKITMINEIASHGRVPDLTIYLHIPLHVREERMSERSKDRMERKSDDFYSQVYNGFEALAQDHPRRIKKLDGSLDEQTLHKEVVSRINELYT